MVERFVYNKTFGLITDMLDGEKYFCNNYKICDLLNRVNGRADLNAELYYDLKIKNMKEIEKLRELNKY